MLINDLYTKSHLLSCSYRTYILTEFSAVACTPLLWHTSSKEGKQICTWYIAPLVDKPSYRISATWQKTMVNPKGKNRTIYSLFLWILKKRRRAWTPGRFCEVATGALQLLPLKSLAQNIGLKLLSKPGSEVLYWPPSGGGLEHYWRKCSFLLTLAFTKKGLVIKLNMNNAT